MEFRIGQGFDVHRLAENESLVLGGVNIPCSFGTVAHSDGDVLLHAICDALLGALALGDIGQHFPDTDPRFHQISSLILLEKVNDLLRNEGWALGNLDTTLILEKPKIGPFVALMREKIAEVLEVSPSLISIKATTSEKLGFVGKGEGVEAMAVCLIRRLSIP